MLSFTVKVGLPSVCVEQRVGGEISLVVAQLFSHNVGCNRCLEGHGMG